MKYNSIEILVSALNDSIYDVNIDAVGGPINYLIVHQVTNDKKYNYSKFTHPNIKVVTSFDIGLSKSRNIAIKKSSKDICIVADDDIIFKREALLKLLDFFNKFTDASVVLFKLKDANNLAFREYNLGSGVINSFKSACSCEISFVRVDVQGAFVFDEMFGLGSVYKGFEENIFLNNIFNSGNKIYFFDKFIATHNDTSHTLTKAGKEYYFAFGAYCKKRWGSIGLMRIVLHFLKLCLKRNKDFEDSKLVLFKNSINGFKEL